MYGTNDVPQQAIGPGQRQGEITAALSDVSGLVTSVEKLAHELSERLTPVLRTESPQVNEKSMTPLRGTPLGQCLDSVAEQLRNLERLLNSTVTRIEL